MSDLLLVLGGWLLVGCAVAWAIGRASDAGRTFDEGTVVDSGRFSDEARPWRTDRAFEERTVTDIGKSVR